MNKILFTAVLSLIALGVSTDASAWGFGGGRGRNCGTCTGRAACPPAPCCTKTVEVKVPARKIVDCTCSWECPSDCVTQGSDYVINSGNGY